jgi:predicted metal-dependent HD superfamily phosphohydrolase
VNSGADPDRKRRSAGSLTYRGTMSDLAVVEGELVSRWLALADEVGAPNQAIGDILDRHREDHRHYHNAEHVLALLRHLDSLDPSGDPAPRLAAFYHDAVYETRPDPDRESNEELSAQLAEAELADCDPPLITRVAALIRATEGHHLIDDLSASVFLDADLSILGSDPEIYRSSTQHIRAEYGYVSDEQFRTGRAAILEGFLNRDTLYYSPQGRELWEQAARNNIAAELELLRG